jgi:predicted ester cyclase
MPSDGETTIRQRLTAEITPDLYRRIRRLWIAHSKAEDGRDLPGLIATLTENCVYEIIPTGQRWEGHEGARAFYTTFLGAFPDVHFDLQDIVIGPQGVIEVAIMSGTHRGTWAGIKPSGRPIQMHIIIHFPWDTADELFSGEKIYFDRHGLEDQLKY